MENQIQIKLVQQTDFRFAADLEVLQGATTHENDRPAANQLNLFEF